MSVQAARYVQLMKLHPDKPKQIMFGSTSGAWVVDGGRWLIRRAQGRKWFLLAVDDTEPSVPSPDDLILAGLGLDQPFATRRALIEAFELAKAGGADL